MVTQRKPKASKYLTTPTRPVQVDRDRSVAGLLEKMEGTGFGGRQLAEAHRIWLDMLGDNTTIMVAASGALIPAGMRRLLAYVIKNRFVDVLVLSGALLFHDLHETLGRYHFQAHPSMTDAELESAQISRMWDLLASDEEYREAKEWIGGFTNQLDQTRAYSVREFLHLLGRELAEIASEDGVLTSAYKAKVPIFCPAIADSGLAVGIAGARFEKKNAFLFDTIQDVLDMMNVMVNARVSGILVTHPDLKLEIEGHTDSVGSDEYNQGLSERRAESVRSYLVSQRIAAQTITTAGFGESRPVATNDNAAGRQRNRRVELVVSGEAIGTH